MALEGPSGAGKTTLSQNLAASLSLLNVIVLPDYSEAAGGPQNLPRAPAETVEEELSALSFLLDVDQRRWQKARSGHRKVDLAVLDRSVHTLLAHRWAVSQLVGLEVFGASCQLASEHSSLEWPNLVLYLDTPQRLLTSRQSSEVPPEARIFVDPDYNALFRSYFIPTLRYTTTPIVVLDGTLSADALVGNALFYIERALSI